MSGFLNVDEAYWTFWSTYYVLGHMEAEGLPI